MHRQHQIAVAAAAADILTQAGAGALQVRLHAALAMHETPAPLSLLAPAPRATPDDAGNGTEDAAPLAEGLKELQGLMGGLGDVLPALELKQPGLTGVVAEVERMVGVEPAKLWVLYMTRFLGAHASALGFRTKQMNFILLGQQVLSAPALMALVVRDSKCLACCHVYTSMHMYPDTYIYVYVYGYNIYIETYIAHTHTHTHMVGM